MGDIFNEDRELNSEVSDLWEFASRYAGLDKNFFLRYVHTNNPFFPLKKSFSKYPIAKVCEEDEYERRREVKEKKENDEGEEEEVVEFSTSVYPPLQEQLDRAEKIVEYAREQFGFLQSNMAIVDLAYFIRYCEFGGDWCWNDEQ